MKAIMDWNYCEEKFIKNIETDPGKISSIIETADSRLKYLKSTRIDEDNVSFIVEGYYEVIKELLVALLIKHGLRSKNHQCLISYFYHKYSEHEAEAHLIFQMSYLRNRLNYYGGKIALEFYEKNKGEFEKIIKLLHKLIKS